MRSGADSSRTMVRSVRSSPCPSADVHCGARSTDHQHNHLACSTPRVKTLDMPNSPNGGPPDKSETSTGGSATVMSITDRRRHEGFRPVRPLCAFARCLICQAGQTPPDWNPSRTPPTKRNPCVDRYLSNTLVTEICKIRIVHVLAIHTAARAYYS